MTRLRIIFLCVLVLAFAGTRLDAALFGGEKKSYEQAGKSYQFKMWERAEREFAEFVEKYPKSEHLAEALLWQAQAQFNQKKFPAIVDLLTKRQGDADKLGDQFLYWIGQAQYEGANYSEAAATFGKLTRDFPTSPKRLEAAVREASSRARLGEWTTVTNLLRNPGGAFRPAALASKGEEYATRGYLLLAEAQLALKNYASAEAALGTNVIGNDLRGELGWQKRRLLCRAYAENGRWAEAAREGVGLIAVAEEMLNWELVAEAVVFRADALEKQGKLDEAITALKRNLSNAPVARQRQALSRITALSLAQGHVEEAMITLESYLNQFTNARASDTALLTLGELHLKQEVLAMEGNTNVLGGDHLSQATNCFSRVIKLSPRSSHLGKAQLNLGWCYWLEKRFTESAVAFGAAVAALPLSEDLAVAKFKLADAQYAKKDFAGAVENYQAALLISTNWPKVREELGAAASYQALRASLEMTNAMGAEMALRLILQANPRSMEADHGVLLVAQAYADANQSGEVERLFREFAARFPDSDLKPEAELLLVRMREDQSDWAGVSAAYDEWLDKYPTNSLRAQVEYRRAIATARAGNETNALQMMTNFVVQYPTNEFAAQAQWWVASHFYALGDYAEAEIGFKKVFQNWKTSDLAYEARMMAGRAAIARPDYANAREHFTSLSGDTNCPIELWTQAVFAYGDVLKREVIATETNRLAGYAEALDVFASVHSKHTTNNFAAQAWGEIGNCYFQMAAQNRDYYNAASNAYQQAISCPNSSVATRSQAKIGLASVLEKQAELAGEAGLGVFLREARNHCLDVYLEKNLRDAESADAYWKGKAGLEAAQLSERLREWQQAIDVYRDMQMLKLLPDDVLNKRIINAEKMKQAGEKSR